jgi:hypothetical protein
MSVDHSRGVIGEAGAQTGLFRVMSPDRKQLYFPGGFHFQESAEAWAMDAWDRDVIDDYVVVFL